MYKCLSIAGFDGSGGAGIQADLKAFSALGCYGMTVLTALPVQNTMGVKRCYPIPLSCIEEQMEAIFEDIVPDSIKIGMLFSKPIIECIANFLKQHAQSIPIVIDPVMVAKSGDPLLESDAIETLRSSLIPLATILTPNLPEAHALLGPSHNPQTLTKQELSEQLLAFGAEAVLLKGGHEESKQATDYFLSRTHPGVELVAERIVSKNTHGTGCTLSAAIAANLARGQTLLCACQNAKNYLFGAIKAASIESVGKGNGPVHHFYACSQFDDK